MTQHSMYHKILRVSAVVLAVVLLFDGGFVAPMTKQLSENTSQYLAQSVGLFASVEQTELNTYTAQLTAKERELAAREAALVEREIANRDFATPEQPDYSIYILSAILFILTVLIVLNYALDWTRAARPRMAVAGAVQK